MKPHEVHFKLHPQELPVKNKVGRIAVGKYIPIEHLHDSHL